MAALPEPYDSLLFLGLPLAFVIALHFAFRRLANPTARRLLGHPLFMLAASPFAVFVALFVGPAVIVLGAIATAWLLHDFAWLATGWRRFREHPRVVGWGSLGALLALVLSVAFAVRGAQPSHVVSFGYLGIAVATCIAAPAALATFVPRARVASARVALYALLLFPAGFAYAGHSSGALAALGEAQMGVDAGGVLAAGAGSILWKTWRTSRRGPLGRWVLPEGRVESLAAVAIAIGFLGLILASGENGMRGNVAVQHAMQAAGIFVGMVTAPVMGLARGWWRKRRATRDDDVAQLAPA